MGLQITVGRKRVRKCISPCPLEMFWRYWLWREEEPMNYVHLDPFRTQSFSLFPRGWESLVPVHWLSCFPHPNPQQVKYFSGLPFLNQALLICKVLPQYYTKKPHSLPSPDVKKEFLFILTPAPLNIQHLHLFPISKSHLQLLSQFPLELFIGMPCVSHSLLH